MGLRGAGRGGRLCLALRGTGVLRAGRCRRGIALHFRAEAALYRPRWYWRDERIGRVRRRWRLTYQPLSNSFRVSIGALHQTYASLPEAMSAITRISRWPVADAVQCPPQLEIEAHVPVGPRQPLGRHHRQPVQRLRQLGQLP